jgi:triphosphoribosyl-dephospho-CoA synthase
MERSIGLVGAYLRTLGGSLVRDEPLHAQIAIAQRAERVMLAELGTNTHKGAIFLSGVLLIASRRVGSDDEPALRAAVSSVASEIAALTARRATHGEVARRRYRVSGILGEVEAGLPSVFDVGVPAFRAAVRRGGDDAAASFAMLARLMQTVEDTTALHRCGPMGLARLRADGARLERLVSAGTHVPFLLARNALYRRLNLTMGGVADLLGVGLGWLAHRGELPHAALPGGSARG